jgi:23S rRNA-/tRNA-specific pseudouridylate synthase
MHQRIPIRLFSATRSSLKVIPGSRNLLHLVEGVYNPPLSMSKSTAKKWAKVAPMKSALIPRTDIKQVAVEKSFILKEQDEGKSLEQVTSAYFGLDPPSARLKILNGEIWLKGSLHAKYADNLRPKQVVHFGDVLAGAIHKPASKDQINRKLDELKKELKENVIFKDKDIIIINKPSNLVTHTGSKHNAINIEALLDIMKTDSDQETPRLVHRLDKVSDSDCPKVILHFL